MAKALQLPSGAWRIKTKIDGKWLSFTAQTKEEVEYKYLQYKLDSKNSEDITKKTLNECIDDYIESNSNLISPSTISLYRTLQKTAYRPIINTKITDITTQKIQKTINAYAAGRAYKTVKNAEAFLVTILKRYRPNFVMGKINLPQREKKQIVIPTTEELNNILLDTKDTDLYLPIMLAALTGMRRSEICALTWDEIDLTEKKIHVREALVYDERGALTRKGTKTMGSTRTIDLPHQIEAALPPRGDRIIMVQPRALSQRFGRVVKRRGYNFTFHGLRHYNASVMLKLGVPDKYAMERMGHATNNMLKTVYQHTFEDEHRAVSERMQSFMDENIVVGK